MVTSFQTIGIIGRVKTAGVKETLKALIDYLLDLKQNILIEEETAESLSDHKTLPIVSREELGKNVDLLIVVGGDGSLLHAAHIAVDNEIPVVGINRGSLGFLTDVLPKQLDKIKDILEGKFSIEKRFLLNANIHFEGKEVGQDDALNEVAIIPDAVPHMIKFEIYIDEVFVCSQDSDGLIVATPTGSTAYALSGGGPILHPQLDAIVLVPMFPHSLNNRPIVVEGNREISIIVSPTNRSSPRLSCDGRAYLPMPTGSHIKIRKKSKTLHLIHPIDYNYYEALRSKLHWGKKLHYME
jgi:NAD+ kinase